MKTADFQNNFYCLEKITGKFDFKSACNFKFQVIYKSGIFCWIALSSLTGGQPLKWYEYSMCYGDADANDYRQSLAESFRQFADLPIVTQTSAGSTTGTRSKQTSPSPQVPPPTLST